MICFHFVGSHIKKQDAGLSEPLLYDFSVSELFGKHSVDEFKSLSVETNLPCKG